MSSAGFQRRKLSVLYEPVVKAKLCVLPLLFSKTSNRSFGGKNPETSIERLSPHYL